MQRLLLPAFLLTVSACFNQGGPVRSDRLVAEFPQHRDAMLVIAGGLSSLKEVGVTRLWVDRGTTKFLIHDTTDVSVADLQRRAPAQLDSVAATLAMLAPRHVINAGLERDGALVCLTWSAGVPAGGGYARVGTGGAAALRSLPGIDWLRPIPGDSTWFTWGT